MPNALRTYLNFFVKECSEHIAKKTVILFYFVNSLKVSLPPNGPLRKDLRVKFSTNNEKKKVLINITNYLFNFAKIWVSIPQNGVK